MGNQFFSPKRMSLEQAVKTLIKSTKGDILMAILFFPVGLMFQKLADTLICSTCDINFSVMVKLALVLYLCILEILIMSLVAFNWGSTSPFHLVFTGLSILVFMVAITVMGYTSGILFRGAFLVSIIMAVWGLPLIEGRKVYGAGSEIDPVEVSIAFTISSFGHIMIFMP